MLVLVLMSEYDHNKKNIVESRKLKVENKIEEHVAVILQVQSTRSNVYIPS